MLEDGYIPEITTVVKDDNDNFISLYNDVVYKILGLLVTPEFFKQKEFDSKLPILKSFLCESTPGHLSIYFFGKFQKHALRFFIEMLSNWLIPGRRLNLSRVFSSEFCIPTFGSTVYMVCEIVIHVFSQSDLEKIRNILPIIKSELLLGIESSFYAKRILEVKGLTTDAKTAVIQENIAYLLERKPHDFNYDMLSEMQHIFVMCKEEFRAQRNSRHLSRMIVIQYYFRKSLAAKIKISTKRHLFLKIFRSEILVQGKKTNVLAIIVGFNFLRDKEIFEKRHLIRAIQNHIPNAVVVENSFFDDRRNSDDYCTFYLEIEKSSGEKFSYEEITKLRKALPIDLVDGIEQLVHSVFMPRNEEEIMRNILSLSTEVKYIRDLPQVMIMFNEQTYSKLSFTVIVVRILKPSDDSIQQLFDKNETTLEYVHDRCKTVGYLRSKYTKEAVVFSVKIKKDEFIRRDHSIDLNKARQAVVFELLKILGDFRDFNGGMISKQNQLLSEVKALMLEEVKFFNDLLFENFFFSIMPTVMRTVLEPELIKTLFFLLQETIEMEANHDKNYLINELIQPANVFLMIKSERGFNREEVNQALAVLHSKSSEIANSYVKVHDVNYNGYIFRCADPQRQKEFISIIKTSVLHRFSETCLTHDRN